MDAFTKLIGMEFQDFVPATVKEQHISMLGERCCLEATSSGGVPIASEALVLLAGRNDGIAMSLGELLQRIL